jgi:hypothetical protein
VSSLLQSTAAPPSCSHTPIRKHQDCGKPASFVACAVQPPDGVKSVSRSYSRSRYSSTMSPTVHFGFIMGRYAPSQCSRPYRSSDARSCSWSMHSASMSPSVSVYLSDQPVRRWTLCLSWLQWYTASVLYTCYRHIGFKSRRFVGGHPVLKVPLWNIADILRTKPNVSVAAVNRYYCLAARRSEPYRPGPVGGW